MKNLDFFPHFSPSQVISAIPQIQSFRVDRAWDFVVVATDGVWDALSNQVIK
jgi:serine/threonine protein phosphatase PrpC